MISDIGLHNFADAPADSAGQDHSPSSESDLFYSLLCACLVYEGIWSLYLGRPSSIPKSIMNIAGRRCQKGQKSSSDALSQLNAWVGLCIPMAEISHILNNCPDTDSQAASDLSDLIAELQDWYNNLPPKLAYQDTRLADMDMTGYGMHTQYCKVQILLNQAPIQPPNTRKRKFSQIDHDQPKGRSSGESRQIVYQNAFRIVRLVVTYREIFGVEKIPSIMLDNAILGATCLIDHLIDQPHITNQYNRDLQWLRSLIKTLEALQPHFPITKRMLATLEQMTEGTSLVNLFRSQPISGGIFSRCEPQFNRGTISTDGGQRNMFDLASEIPHTSDSPWGTLRFDGPFFWDGIDHLFPEFTNIQASS